MTTPARITLTRTKGWRMPEDTRVVTRATIFGNPFVVGDPGGWRVPEHDGKPGWGIEWRMDRAINAYQAVIFFSAWLHQPQALAPMPSILNDAGRTSVREAMDARRALILSRLPELRGRPLACFCKPGCPCHADVLLEIANR